MWSHLLMLLLLLHKVPGLALISLPQKQAAHCPAARISPFGYILGQQCDVIPNH